MSYNLPDDRHTQDAFSTELLAMTPHYVTVFGVSRGGVSQTDASWYVFITHQFSERIIM